MDICRLNPVALSVSAAHEVRFSSPAKLSSRRRRSSSSSSSCCPNRSSQCAAGRSRGGRVCGGRIIGGALKGGRSCSWRSVGVNAMAHSTDVKDGAELKVYESAAALDEDLAAYVSQLSASAVKERGAFTVVLSGGSLISTLGKLTEEPYLDKIDWSRWHVFWVDERVVPLDHPDSNYKLAYDGLLSKVPIPPGNVYAINDKLGPQAASEDYEFGLRQLVKTKIVSLNETGDFPRFDLMLLGMGPDGHIASLFPNHPLVSKTDSWIASIEDSPKPPPQRITFTLPVINAAENIAFVAMGSGKAEKLKLVFGEELPFGELPAQLVHPVNGKLVWFTDKGATAKL